VKQFFIVGCCIGHMPSFSLYPKTERYLRHFIACVETILVVSAGGYANVACGWCDGITLSSLVGILNGSATSILGLRCFDGPVVDVLDINLDVVVTCVVTGAGSAVTVPVGACGNCDVLTACGRCGALVPFHQLGVGLILCDVDDILVGGGSGTGVADITGIAGVTIGVIIGTVGVISGVTGVITGITAGLIGITAGFIGITAVFTGISVGFTGVTVGATGITTGDTAFGFGCSCYLWWWT